MKLPSLVVYYRRPETKKTWDIRRRCHLLQVAGIHTAADFDRWGNVKGICSPGKVKPARGGSLGYNFVVLHGCSSRLFVYFLQDCQIFFGGIFGKLILQLVSVRMAVLRFV